MESQKKIYILTTQYANNIGAQLQCYALSKYLNLLPGVNCQVLRYLPKGHNRSWTILRKPRSFRDVLKLIYDLIRIDFLPLRIKKRKKMKEFISRYIPSSETQYDRNKITNHPPIADIFIVGSDQIWNFNLRMDFTYFLDFIKDTNTKKISYAASIADDWDEQNKIKIKPFINQFDKISIREEGNLECINSVLVDKKATVVCDPVFLLSKKEWDMIKSPRLIEGPYILCYFLSVSNLAVEVVSRIKELTGLKIVYLNLNTIDKFNSDVNIKDGDPSDFIRLIADASYICTNSFHCSAFSIIYKKNFIFVPKKISNKRIIQLEKIFNINVIINKEKIKNLSKQTLNLTYQENAGSDFINYSKAFLKDIIYETN